MPKTLTGKVSSNSSTGTSCESFVSPLVGGIVDQDIDGAEGVDCLACYGNGYGVLANIPGKEHSLATGLCYQALSFRASLSSER